MLRREAIRLFGSGLVVLPGLLGAQGPSPDQARPHRGLPALDHPIPFDTPEADKILEALQVFPPDNPWNLDVSSWPIHPNSKAIIASIGADKPLRYSPDMGFVLIPPDQPRVPVRITDYAGESDRGPFPVPEILTIEGWPASYRRDPKLRSLSLDDVQRDKARLGGDRHAIAVDPAGMRLYEFYAARKTAAGWEAKQASVFDLTSNSAPARRLDLHRRGGVADLPGDHPPRRAGQGPDRARGPGDRPPVEAGLCPPRDALRQPARRPEPAPDGERLRPPSRLRHRRVLAPRSGAILEGLKQYGMLVADNGLDWMISVAPDERIPVLHEELRKVNGSDFEVIREPG